MLSLIAAAGGWGDLFPLIFVTIYLTYKFVYLISFQRSCGANESFKYGQGATDQQAGRFLREVPDFQT